MTVLSIPSKPFETLMPLAPSVILSNGRPHVPQHYVQYRHSITSVAQLISEIEFDTHTPLFAAEDAGGMYLQVGLIGRENYDRSHTIRPQKLVYGRKWRIDRDTPSSEIIQTAFLAIKKAREHELRELLTFRKAAGQVSAPFSSHQDLALMAQNPELVHAPKTVETAEALRSCLLQWQFAQRPIEVLHIEQRHNQTILLDIRLGEPPLARKIEADFPEFDGLELTLLLQNSSASELLYALMDALIAHSDHWVARHFTYQGLHRFSRKLDPQRIAGLSISTRPYQRDMQNKPFEAIFRLSNYAVDAGRAPDLGSGPLADKNRQLISRFEPLAGHLPSGYATKHERATPAEQF
ncbi:hypothetical protein WAE56_20045 [Iodobacter sp. LRB]|uniref:hypothetical protein n=1 Tax=unclassified Iodobacter TaxID=235634 RepID=UPI000C0F2B86|nr:hypothetical protein [Iodobacter sp. BJB302]PHU99658.1 hypothetical protein CSQ88_21330 [Iodobacter sp. BJB302]